jgi:hypothetical protein
VYPPLTGNNPLPFTILAAKWPTPVTSNFFNTMKIRLLHGDYGSGDVLRG